MNKYLKYFRRSKISKDVEDSIRKAEDALKSISSRLHTFDPNTDQQWRSLKNRITESYSLKVSYPFNLKRLVLKPAFSFSLAVALLAVITLVIFRFSTYKTYETQRGEQSTIMLMDSTEIKMNYVSRLKVNKSVFDKTREVELEGEALFHVRRDGTPFIVLTEMGEVHVLGTKFNINTRGERMEVAVLEGRVRVTSRKDNIDSTVIVEAGKYVSCEKNNFPEYPKSLPFRDYPGWLQDKFMFYRTKFISACEELQLKFDVQIKLNNPAYNDLSITGVVDGKSIEEALSTLTLLTSSKYRYEDGSYIIY